MHTADRDDQQSNGLGLLREGNIQYGGVGESQAQVIPLQGDVQANLREFQHILVGTPAMRYSGETDLRIFTVTYQYMKRFLVCTFFLLL